MSLKTVLRNPERALYDYEVRRQERQRIREQSPSRIQRALGYFSVIVAVSMVASGESVSQDVQPATPETQVESSE